MWNCGIKQFGWFRAISLACVLLLGGYLRFSAITWGIPTIDYPHEPFHPDETWALHVLGYTSVENGLFNPKEAHREGTLSYFIWLAVGWVAKQAGFLKGMPPFHLAGPDLAGDPAAFLILGRSVVAVSDLLCSILVFACVVIATRRFWAALLGMLVLIITPFEIIYAHYMRTHVMSNLMLTVTLLISFRMVTLYSRSLAFAGGFGAGLSFATRYPTAVVGIAPLAVCLYHEARSKFQILKSLITSLNFLSSAQLWLLLCGLLTGAFLGAPFLFLDYQGAKPHLIQQASYFNQSEFSVAQLLDISRLKIYLTYLIPYGMRPWLWLLSYASVLFLLLRPRLYKFSIPVLLTGVTYFYFMAKGFYATPTFVRAAIGLFPVFAIVVGLAASEFYDVARSRRFVRWSAGVLATVVVLSTIWYDCAYLRAMNDDPRDQIFQYLRDNYKGRTLSIGVLRQKWTFFTTVPPLQAISDPKLRIVEGPIESNSDADLYIIARFDRDDEPNFSNSIVRLVDQYGYHKLAVFQTPVSFLGVAFDSLENPHDMNYPLPMYLLFEKART